jgi:hypothetical protein
MNETSTRDLVVGVGSDCIWAQSSTLESDTTGGLPLKNNVSTSTMNHGSDNGALGCSCASLMRADICHNHRVGTRRSHAVLETWEP